MNFNKRNNETELEYILRICSQKDVVGTWAKVASILNENLNQNYDESAYRKKYQSYKALKSIATLEKEEEIDNLTSDNNYLKSELNNSKNEL